MNADITISITDPQGSIGQTSASATTAPPPLPLEDLGSLGASDAPPPLDLAQLSGGAGAAASGPDTQDPPAPMPLDQLSTAASSASAPPAAVATPSAAGCCGAPEPLSSEELDAALAASGEGGEGSAEPPAPQTPPRQKASRKAKD